MKKKIISILAVAIIIIVIVFAAASNQDANTSDSNKEIRVGVIVPLSGQYAFLGESERNAILLAQKELGANNLKFYFEDDKYDPKTAVTAYQNLKSLHDIDAAIVMGAPSIQSIKPLTDKDNIPLLGMGVTLVYEKDSVFQLMPSGDTLNVVLGQRYAEKYKNIAIAHSNADLFMLNAERFKAGLTADVKTTEFILPPSNDYRTVVQKIIATNPDATTVFLPKDDGIKFLKALRVQDRTGKIKIVCDFQTEIAVKEYTEAIGADRLEGCISTNIANTAAETFKRAYKTAYNSDLQITADFAYDAVDIIKSLASKPTDSWISILSAPDFKFTGKASGPISFNADGTRVDLPPTVHVYKNGEFIDFK